MQRISVGDEVIVISGEEKGKRGKVTRVLKERGSVLVEGVNQVKRHLKATPQRGGGILEKEGSVEGSNVSLWCGKCVAPRRAHVEEKEGHKKRRVCVKCGTVFETA